MTKIQSDSQPQNPEQQKYISSLRRLDRYAQMLDSKFRIPFTRIRFGLDPVIGLVPGVGDVAGLGLSLYLIGEAIKIGAGTRTIVKMLGNVLVEFVIGLVPLFGDAFDLMWKANDRNAALVRAHIEQKLTPSKPRRRWLSYGLVTVFGLVLVSLAVLVFQALFLT
ncbi:MAG: DUF4112 domain-containing protein [Marinobacter sp.]|uniref:DUF4112 domain-containing protein n=1 Tax=Marinobacter sp. TaxID=50741 RepID=UPI0034A01E2B